MMNSNMEWVKERSSGQGSFRHHGFATAPALTGRLVAPLAGGIGYRTATQHGVTTRQGEFRYQQGERIIFFIGNIALPPASAGSTVTPYDMGRSSNEAVNVVRLMHALCEEGGTLPRPAAATGSDTIDFAAAPHLFALLQAVQQLVRRTGRPLIDEITAIELLDTTLARYIRHWQ